MTWQTCWVRRHSYMGYFDTWQGRYHRYKVVLFSIASATTDVDDVGAENTKKKMPVTTHCSNNRVAEAKNNVEN